MDRETIIRKINFAEERINKIEMTLKQYETCQEQKQIEILYLALQRLSEEVIESVIKINIFILKQQNYFPKSYQESFLLLKNITQKFNYEELKTLSKTAKFRNILAHEYQDIKEDEVIKKIKQIQQIYPTYLKTIYSLIK